MIVCETGPDSLKVRGIPHALAESLRRMQQLCQDLPQQIEARLYPEPSPDDPQLVEDWKAHVEPELQRLFLDARAVASADIKRMQVSEVGVAIEIPFRHADAWLNALNQARLVLAGLYGFTEAEMARRPNPPFDTPSARARLDIDFFAALQEWIMEALDESA